MIDFDELDDANSTKLRFVANLDYAGVSRGECSCCDCLEWLSPDESSPERLTDLKSHPYNVTRRLEASSDGKRGSMLSVLAANSPEAAAATLAAGTDPSARSSEPVGWSGSCVEYCARCGCHAMWHEDICDKVTDLNERGLLVEAQPGWSDVERALFWQTGGAFQPGLGAFSRSSSSSPSGARQNVAKSGTEEVLVSVVCPTSVERRTFHSSLYHCFNQQRHPAKELIVVETGSVPEPSLCFTVGSAANDSRVTYRYYNDTASPWSIGAKRNLACYLASGAVIVHFDDDDLYTPGYLGLMVRALQLGGGGRPDLGVEPRLADPLSTSVGEPHGDSAARRDAEPAEGSARGTSPEEPRAGVGEILASALAGSAGVSVGTYMEGSLRGFKLDENPNPPLRGSSGDFDAEAVTLSAWFTFNVATGGFGICDVDKDHDKRQSWTLGYGFTFAYLRDAWSSHWFRDVNLGEDCDFFEALLARGARVVLLRDCVGFCAHTHHEANFSPWERDREVPSDIVSTTLREMATKLGSNLKVAKQRASSDARKEKAKAVTLTPTAAASLQDELIAEYTKERFQIKLHTSWWQNREDVSKQMRERSLICLEVQAPIIERYGFPPSMEGVLLSMKAFTPEINELPNMSKKNWLCHWLCKPEMQASTPIEAETLADMISNLTKNAKVRRRRT